MSVSARQSLSMALLIVLPLCVSVLTALGLLRLDAAIATVAEEYEEVRMLEPIDRSLAMAAAAIKETGGITPGGTERERLYLKEAEAGLVTYLANQYRSVATVEHQAEEAAETAALLRDLQAMLATGGAADRTEISGSGRLIEVTRVHKGMQALYLAADKSVTEAHGQALRARRETLWLVACASVVSTAVCVYLVVWSSRSVNNRLRGLHRRLAEQTPGVTVRPASGIGAVVEQIEDLNERVLQRLEESGRELLRRERLAGVGLLAADVAHEINNPMNATLGLSELALRSVERGPVNEQTRVELEESLRVIRREAVRCKGIVERLMALVRSDSKPVVFDAIRLVQETVRVAQAARPDRAQCFVVPGTSASVTTLAPPDEVRQILLTLMINAADAVGHDGRIEADAIDTGSEVWFRIRDNGRGFTDEMRRTFFQSFQSHRGEGEARGTGLGLAIAHALAEGMGATLTPFSEGPGRGSLFVLAIRAREVRP